MNDDSLSRADTDPPRTGCLLCKIQPLRCASGPGRRVRRFNVDRLQPVSGAVDGGDSSSHGAKDAGLSGSSGGGNGSGDDAGTSSRTGGDDGSASAADAGTTAEVTAGTGTTAREATPALPCTTTAQRTPTVAATFATW